MLKRANNITSLLVAAAAIISLVPTGVSAAEAKTIDAQNGTIYTAVPFSNGSYYLDAEIDGKDEAVYYVSPDGKYNELPSGTSSKGNEIEQGSFASSFAGKYARINNNDMYLADYTVDMTNGTVTDTDAKQDMVDAVGKALKGQIKDADDRYASPKDVQTYLNTNGNGKITRKAGNYFIAQYKAKNLAEAPTDSTGLLYVYTDINGNYIDGDYNLGTIKVETTTAGSVTISNTKDSENIKDGTVSASLSKIKNIDHDKDNFYRWATITVSSTTPMAKINGVEIIDKNTNKIKTAFTDVKKDQTEISYNVLQKLSKASASDEIDGAKYAKTVANYVLADEDGVAIDGLDGSAIGSIANRTYQYYISNGKISVYNINTSSKNVTIRPYEFKSNGNWKYVDEGSKSTEDCEVANDSILGTIGAVAASGGVLYRLDSGYLYAYDNNGGWNKFYKVDSSMNEFVVENAGNMILWNKDKEAYSVISTKPEVTTTTGTTATTVVTTATTATAVTAGWVKTTDGIWNYNKADGTKATGWIKDGSSWYFLKADGVMATGWVKDESTWYLLNGSGAMKTGWINDNATWYYCNESGAMLANTTVDGYVLGATGAWIK